jgi:UDP-GlcNAc:undecaprenyl-phosphate GlcNAc-1-phosphate transferase
VKPYLIVFGVAAGVSFLATPVIRRIAVFARAIDHPSDRKVHPRPTPTLGGVAIFIGVIAALGVAQSLPYFEELFRVSSEPTGVLIAGGVLVAVGAFDDVRGTAVPVKLAGQLLAAGLLVLSGIQLLYFFFPGQGILSLGPDLAVPLTVLWTVGMVNAINLIDGLDGLAAGIVVIAAGTFFVYTYQDPGQIQPSASALIASIAAGGALGFLPWNFHPARIFMGDSGAMLLGLLLAAATVSGVGRNFVVSQNGGDLAAFSIPVLLPLVILAVPLLDVLFAIIRRILRGRPLTHPDKQHIHHRLMEFGHTHRQAVLLMYLWSGLIAGTALSAALINRRALVGGIAIGAVAIILATALPRALGRRTRPARHRRARGQAPTTSGPPPSPDRPV